MNKKRMADRKVRSLEPQGAEGGLPLWTDAPGAPGALVTLSLRMVQSFTGINIHSSYDYYIYWF